MGKQAEAKHITVPGVGKDYKVIANAAVPDSDCREIVQLLEREGALPYRAGGVVGQEIKISLGGWEVEIGEEKYQVCMVPFSGAVMIKPMVKR